MDIYIVHFYIMADFYEYFDNPDEAAEYVRIGLRNGVDMDITVIDERNKRYWEGYCN